MSSNVIPGGLRSLPTSPTAISRSNGLLPESLSYTILSSSRRAEDGHPSAAAAVASSLDYRDRPIQTAGRKKEARPMALGNSYTAFTGNHTELNGDPDFDALVSPDGYISVCGFGSLLSERSARSTFPDLKNFRIASLYGFRRVFCHVAPIFFERGIANEETGEISSLSVEPCEGETLVVTVFDVKRSEVPSFIEREHEFRFLSVVPEDLNGTPYSYPAVLCARYSDDEYFRVRCKGSKEILFKRYGQYNIHRIWRDDILPCRVYLRHCVLAAKNLGEAAYNNFVDHTFLSNRKTTIREYLSSTGSGIMEEEPPEALNVRYGG